MKHRNVRFVPCLFLTSLLLAAAGLLGCTEDGPSQATADADGSMDVTSADQAADTPEDDTAATVTCGDGVVAGDEACDDGNTDDGDGCSATCRVEGPDPCGDGTCSAGETPESCPDDCMETDPCGNGTCDEGETIESCPDDCTQTGLCGNGMCDEGETPQSCPDDCTMVVDMCGNGTCDMGEDPTSCADDCPAEMCGNAMCEDGEDAETCPQDCGDCAPEVCDQPGAVAVNSLFKISDNGDGTYSATGGFGFQLYGVENGNVTAEAICSQTWQFAADFEPIANPTGCDANGQNCTTICPVDDPAVSPDPVGGCEGHFTNIGASLNTYETDCNFPMEVDWFHPESASAVALLENFLFSNPVESSIPTGTQSPATWGDWADQISSDLQLQPRWQISFVNANRDMVTNEFQSWTNSGFLFGLTAEDPNDLDGPNEDSHQMINLFLLVFN